MTAALARWRKPLSVVQAGFLHWLCMTWEDSMNIRTRYLSSFASRSSSVLLMGFLVSPTGASTIAPSQQRPPAVERSVPLMDQPTAGFVAPSADDRQGSIVMLANANQLRGTELVLHAETSAEAPAPSVTRSNGLDSHLPEPGPLSAIVATLALAGFVLIRRAS